MLELKNIKKTYVLGETKTEALKGISISFRESEFVSILGPSGCGKTTLLNIIGGLDGYTGGDLLINGKSTKKFRDRDWDIYRNKCIGFVFQSYNLIPHQSVLKNVELALTLSGVSPSERVKRATEALCKVGLSEQIHKKPNQLSGGQMQRVAIARALVNDPDIILADEPTGALDSETSVQVMEILKEISKDRLIIMVTHNPELAEKYSTRIINLLDGNMVNDSAPYEVKNTEKNLISLGKKRSMSFLTALTLSFNNLLTKKGRTFLTSFAGSIGIIGIALILSVSQGVQSFIDAVERDTLSSYPITIESQTVDYASLINTIMGKVEANMNHEKDAVYENNVMFEMMNSLSSAGVNTNNLPLFKEELENENSEINKYLLGTQYVYDFDMAIYSKDDNGEIVKADLNELMIKMYGLDEMPMPSQMDMMKNQMGVFGEMLRGDTSASVNDVLKNQYDVIYGEWPKAYNEVVLVVSENNEISDIALYALGLKTQEEMKADSDAFLKGETSSGERKVFSYEDITKKEYTLILPNGRYKLSEDGKYHDISESDDGLELLYQNGIKLKISGIIRPNESATSTMLSCSVGYTAALAEKVISLSETDENVLFQLKNPDTDILTGLPFKPSDYKEPTKAEKAEEISEHFKNSSMEQRAECYISIMATPTEEYINSTIEQSLSSLSRAEIEAMMISSISQSGEIDEKTIKEYLSSMDDEKFLSFAKEQYRAVIIKQYSEQVRASLSAMPKAALSAGLDTLLATKTEEEKAELYDEYMPPKFSESTLHKNLKKLGFVDKSSPKSINLFANTFDDKDNIAVAISNYNNRVEKEDEIEYTDYMALLMSSITTIINAVSYVLIAFVAISLIVSSIMIGIITYISVLERTKEIGILRAIGASKKDVSRVFNAETLVVGGVSGLIGIGFTLICNIFINIILNALTGIPNLKAYLPPMAAVILVVISMMLTFIAGLVPAKIASRKNPVEALRTE